MKQKLEVPISISTEQLSVNSVLNALGVQVFLYYLVKYVFLRPFQREKRLRKLEEQRETVKKIKKKL